MEKEYFDNFSKEAQQFFCDRDFIPDNDYDATNFINSVSGTSDNRVIVADYFDDKKNQKIEITKDNYLYGFYPKIWQTLSVEDRTFLLYNAYKDLSNKYGVNVPLFWTDEENGTYANGECSIDNKSLYIGFDNALNKNGYNGINVLALMSHELNHARQNILAKAINKLGSSYAENYYQKSLCSHSVLKMILDSKILPSHLDNEHSKRLLQVKDSKEWEDFVNWTYYGNYAEISSGRVQEKSFLDFATDVYSHFGKNCLNDPLIVKYFKMTYDLYNRDTADKIFFGNNEFVNKINQLICSYIDETKVISRSKFILDENKDSLKKSKKYTDDEKIIGMKKIEDSLNYMKQCDKEIERKENICINALIDLFYFKRKPDNFDESIFKDIDKSIDFKKNVFDFIIFPSADKDKSK
jgi:hypothetical protein